MDPKTPDIPIQAFLSTRALPEGAGNAQHLHCIRDSITFESCSCTRPYLKNEENIYDQVVIATLINSKSTCCKSPGQLNFKNQVMDLMPMDLMIATRLGIPIYHVCILVN